LPTRDMFPSFAHPGPADDLLQVFRSGEYLEASKKMTYAAFDKGLISAEVRGGGAPGRVPPAPRRLGRPVLPSRCRSVTGY
jgi:hypothetical protein